MPTEEWRSVVGYEDLYEVSDLGRVRRKGGTPKCRVTRLLTPVPMKKRGGYMFRAARTM